MRIFNILLMALLLTLSLSSYSQYSRDDAIDPDFKEIKISSPERPIEPKERLEDYLRRKNFGVFRTQLQAGILYSTQELSLKDRSANANFESTRKGVGWEVLGSFGWDFRFHPIYFDLGLGYQNVFPTENNTLHRIPLRMGFFRRLRMGRDNFFRFGLRSGFAIAKDKSPLFTTGESEIRLEPIVEPTVLLNLGILSTELCWVPQLLSNNDSSQSLSFRLGLLL